MSATNQREDDWLDLFFTNVAAPNVGDAGGLQPSATPGSLHASAHTSDPGETATAQTQNEATYTNYARVAIARALAQWTVLNGNVDNDNIIQFPQSGSGPETLTHFGLGFALAGAGYLDFFGALTSSLEVNNGVQPEFAPGALDISLD